MMHHQEERRKSTERRQSQRYRAAVRQAQLGWWEGEEFRTTEAGVQDISLGGARLNLAARAPRPGSVWVNFPGPGAAEWVAAQVVGSGPDAAGGESLRVEFADGCPYDTFRSVAWGNPPPAGAPLVAAPAPAAESAAPRPVPDRRARGPAPDPGQGQGHALHAAEPDRLPFAARRPTRPEDRPHHAVAAAPRPPEVHPPPPEGEPDPAAEPRPEMDLRSVQWAEKAAVARVGLLAYVVPTVSALSIVAVLVTLLNQEYGNIRPIEVILATMFD
jgi:hypothetical protein